MRRARSCAASTTAFPPSGTPSGGGNDVPRTRPHTPVPYTVAKREQDRWCEVRDPRGELVRDTVYERGAVNVVRRLAA